VRLPTAPDRAFQPFRPLPPVDTPIGPTPVATEKPFHEYALPEHIVALYLSPDGTRVAGAGNGTIRVWTVPDWKDVIEMQLPDKGGAVLAFATDGKALVSYGISDRKIRTWNLANGKQTNECALPRQDLERVIGFAPGGTSLALHVRSGLILVDSKTGAVAAELAPGTPGEQPSPFPYSCEFSPDGKRFAAIVNKTQFAVWDVATGKQLVRRRADTPPNIPEMNILKFSSDGSRIATATEPNPKPIQVWDAATGELLRELTGTAAPSWGFTWMPNGTLIARQPENMVTFDVGTGKVIQEFRTTPWLGGIRERTADGKYFLFLAPVNYVSSRAYFCRLPETK
jgi:WD40 repeat protein